MKLVEKATREVTATVLSELRTVVEGMRDSALEVAGQRGNDAWQMMVIEWRNDKARATISNLGSSCIDLALKAETHSSNGVHSVSDFDVKLLGDDSAQAYVEWTSDWSKPIPGGNFGRREGDEAVDQLASEISRFIAPITKENVKVILT